MKKILYIIIVIVLQVNFTYSQLDKNKSVGTTTGSFDVNLTGAATYQVPIFTPPGTAGMQPSIALTYNSQGGIGIMGKGWNISGLSSIVRTGKTIYHDGKIEGLQFDNTDHYMLDGNLLIQIPGTNEFGTEIETFIKIIAYPSADNPSYFKVYSKDGKTLVYDICNTVNNNKISWNISSIYDESENGMSFVYETINDIKYISSVHYTYNHLASQESYNEIRFTYIQNQPSFKKYFFGNEQYNNVLLKEVKSFAENNLVRKYILNYENKDNISYLKEIKESNSDGQEYNAITFEWTDGITVPGGYHTYQNIPYPELEGALAAFLADADGNGRDDIIIIKNRQVIVYDPWLGSYQPVESITNITTPNVLVGDVNGDGRADLVEYNVPGDNYYSVYVSLANPNNPYEYYPRAEWMRGQYSIPPHTFLTDMNGDGMVDLLTDDFFSGINIYLSNSSSFATHIGVPDQNNISLTNGKIIPADINGDGLQDIIVFAKESTSSFTYKAYSYINWGITFSRCTEIGSFTLWKDNLFSMKDVNGDGLADIVTTNSLGNGIYVSLSKGDGTFESIVNWASTNVPTDLYTSSQTQQEAPVYLSDVNGDGLPDIIRVINKKIYFALNTGNSFVYKGNLTFPYDYTYESIFLGDINSDGAVDITKFNIREKIFTHCYSTGYVLDEGNRKISDITDGLGRLIVIEYETQKDKDYDYYSTLGVNTPHYPFIYLNNKLPVVSRVYEYMYKRGNMINNRRYFFSKPIIHMHGKGFLGFQIMEIENSRDNIELNKGITISNIKTLFLCPYSKSYYNNDSFYKYEKFTYNVEELPNNRFSFTKTSDAVYDYLNSVNLHTAYTYDISGNLTHCYTSWLNCTDGGYCRDTVKTESVNTTYARYGMAYKPLQVNIIKKIPDNEPHTQMTKYSYYSDGKLDTEFTYGQSSTLYKNAKKYSDYNIFGQPTKTTVKTPGFTDEQYITSYTYDSKGRFIIQETNPIGHIIKYEYDSKYGNITKLTDPNNLITTYEYNAWGALKKTIYPDNTIAEQMFAWLTSQHNGLPDVLYYKTNTMTGQSPITIYFDALGREVCCHTQSGFSGAANIYVDTRYNKKGLTEKKSMPYTSLNTSDFNKTWTTYTYDNYNRLTEETAPLSHKTYTYSLRKLIFTDLLNESTRYTKEYDALGQLVKSIDPGGIITYTYNALGLPVITNYNGQTTTMTYDNFGNRISITEPNAGTTTFVYNNYGQMTRSTDAKGNYKTYTYDKLGRITQKYINGSSSAEGSVAYTYDTGNKAKGKISSVTAPNHITSYEYDNLGRTISENQRINNINYYTYYAYNNIGQLIQLTYPGGYSITYQYNSAGELKSIKNPNNEMIWNILQKNVLGQPTYYTWGHEKYTQLSYDNLGNLTNIYSENPTASNRGDKTIQNWQYIYNDRGLLSKSTCNKTNQYQNYTYDNLNRLTEINGSGNYYHSIHYDNTGNIQHQNNVGNYIYSGTPHAVSKIIPILGISQAKPCYTEYTPFNKIKRIIEGQTMLEFSYGNDQQRIYTMETTQIGSAYVSKSHIYVNGIYEEETNLFNNTTRKLNYIFAGGGLLGIYVQSTTDPSEKMYYVHTDRLGNYDVVTDADGNIIDQLSFDAWGKRRNPNNWEQSEPTGTEHLFNRGFTGHEHLDKFNIINMNGRLYDPVIGRFFSPDSYVQNPNFSQNFNRYSYCMNNPLMFTDPDGEFILGIVTSIAMIGYDLLTNNWGGWEKSGKPALIAGIASAIAPVAGITGADLLKFGAKEVANKFFSENISVNVNFDNWSFSFSPGIGYSTLDGFNWGANLGVGVIGDNWDTFLGFGMGSNYIAYGGGFSINEWGASYYSTHYGNVEGPDKISNSQIVGGVSLNFGKDVSFRIENDFLAFQGEDRWRSSAWELRIKKLTLGSTVYTNDPMGEAIANGISISEATDMLGTNMSGKTNKHDKGAWKNGQVYSSPLWIGYRSGNNIFRMGYSHSIVQDKTQNWVHRYGFFYLPFGYQNYYNKYYNFKEGYYGYSGYYNPFSLYNK